MRADLQRYFGLNFDLIGIEFSHRHAAACLTCLPAGSSLLARINPKCTYTKTEMLLHAILNMLSSEHIPYPWEDSESGDVIELSGFETKEEYLAWEQQEWEEDTGDGICI